MKQDAGVEAQITSLFWSYIDDIDAIFNVSQTLHDLYKDALTKLGNQLKLPPHQQRVITNSVQALENILPKSITHSEKQAWRRLFTQGLILTVSISEQILKSVFEHLLLANIDRIKKIQDIQLSLSYLKENNFELDRQKLGTILLERVASNLDPDEKLNFQNVNSIELIFKNYFDIDLDLPEDLRSRLCFFYQVRHIMVHNGGFIDKKFLDRITAAGIKDRYNLNEKIEVRKRDYELCKSMFEQFFGILDAKIAEKGLEFEL